MEKFEECTLRSSKKISASVEIFFCKKTLHDYRAGKYMNILL